MMKSRLALPFLLLLSSSAIAGAQIVPVDMNPLNDGTSSYMHMDEGRFISMRSCWMQWIDIRFTVAEFDTANNMLTLEGTIVQSNGRYSTDPGPMMIMVGPMTGRVDIRNSMQVRERRSLGDNGNFREKILVQPGDALCFSPAIPPADSLGNRRINGSTVKLYYIGRLAE